MTKFTTNKKKKNTCEEKEKKKKKERICSVYYSEKDCFIFKDLIPQASADWTQNGQLT